MTNTEIIQAIKAEIESLKSIEYPCDNSQQATGFCDALDRMTDFLSTLEEKSEIPNDLEEAAKEYAKTTFKKPYSGNPDEEVTIVEPDKYAGFIAGAKWQKGQMMKGAVEGTVHNFSSYKPHPTVLVDANGFNQGDKVLVIVLPKEEERKPTSTSQSKYLEKSDYEFIKNCFENKLCYNCGLRKECERENPDTYEPIGTCSNWTKE